MNTKPVSPHKNNLELHPVGSSTTGQGEAGCQVVLQIGDSLDRLQESLINGLLVCDLVGGQRLLLGLSSEELALALLLLGRLRLLEVGVGELIRLDLGHIDLGRGGDAESLVDATQRHTVHLEGTSHAAKTRLKLLEEHNPLSPEAAGQDDKNGAGGDASPQLGGLGGHRVLLPGHGHIIGGVEFGCLLGDLSCLLGGLVNGELAAVLFLDRPQTTAMVGLGATALAHATDGTGCGC